MSVHPISQWRRPGCDTRCWRGTVLIVGEQQTRTVEAHDPDAHEDYVREALGVVVPERARGYVQFGPLRVDFRSGHISVLSMPVKLREKPSRLLMYMARNPGRLLPTEELIAAVWGDEYVPTDAKDSMNPPFLRGTVSVLKRNLWEAAPLIENVHGQGYRLNMELPR